MVFSQDASRRRTQLGRFEFLSHNKLIIKELSHEDYDIVVNKKMKINILFTFTLFIFLLSFSFQKYENGFLKKPIYSEDYTNTKDSGDGREDFTDKKKADTKDNINEDGTNEANPIDTADTSDTTLKAGITITADESSIDLLQDAPATDENKDRTHVNIKCLFVTKYNVYTLQPLTKDTEYKREVEVGGNILGILHFNICKDLPNEKSTMIFEPGVTTTSLLTAENNETNKIKLAGSIDGGENGSKNEWKEIDEDGGTKGVKIRLSEGDVCNGNTHHVTYLRIICDDKAKDDLFTNDLNFSRFNERDCVHYIESRSIYGCALNDWYLLRRLVNQYNYIFSTLLILVGLFLLLFGKKFQTLTVIVVGGVIVCYVVSVIILSFIPGLIKTEGHLCILFAVGFILGGVLGYCIKEKIKILSVLMGAFAGYSVGEFIYQFVAGFITSNPTALYWAVIAICTIAGGLIGYWLFNTAVIFGTSIIGGYVAMRGVSFIFGNYMDEAEFVDLAKSGEIEQLKDIKNGWVYAYLGLWLVLSIVGIYYQCSKHRKDDSESKK